MSDVNIDNVCETLIAAQTELASRGFVSHTDELVAALENAVTLIQQQQTQTTAEPAGLELLESTKVTVDQDHLEAGYDDNDLVNEDILLDRPNALLPSTTYVPHSLDDLRTRMHLSSLHSTHKPHDPWEG